VPQPNLHFLFHKNVLVISIRTQFKRNIAENSLICAFIRCSQSCASRKRRNADEDSDQPEGATKTYEIKRGPVRFKDKIPEEAGGILFKTESN